MDYIKKTWVNVPDPLSYEGDLNSLPRFDAENMNRIEEGINEAVTGLKTQAPSGHGLGTISPTYKEDFKKTLRRGNGFYTVSDANDAPNASTAWLNLLQSVRDVKDGVETGSQLVFRDFDTTKPQMWLRTLINGSVSNWVEMLHTGNANKVITGTYTGDGAESRFIDLGFTPDAVLIFNRCGFPSIYGFNTVSKHYGGLALKNHGCYQWKNNKLYPIIDIVEGGFKVYVSEYNSGSQYGMNVYTHENEGTFYYVAIKGGLTYGNK